MRSLLGVVAMVLLSTAFAFGLAEAWLRLFPPSGMPISQPHPTLGYTYLPNIDIQRVDIESRDLVRITTNAFGFRDDWTDGGGPRIMVVGDSYVAGVHVDEPSRFTELAEEQLRSSYPRARVFNVGKGGTAASIHLRYVERLLPVLDPDLTVVSIYNGNDFGEINASLNDDVPARADDIGYPREEDHAVQLDRLLHLLRDRLPPLSQSPT